MSSASLAAAALDNNVDFTMLNPAGQPVVFDNSPAVTLTCNLTNSTGSDIAITEGIDACILQLYFPICFAQSDLEKMNIQLADWKFSVDSGGYLQLQYNGAGATWTNGDMFSWEVTAVQTNAQPTLDTAQINFINFGAGLPALVTAPLTVSDPPAPGNGDLTKVLQVSLDNQGMVIVSPTGDPLQNTVFLNIKNIGATPLYQGQQRSDTPAPTIKVVFVYGSSNGSLAPDDKSNIAPGSGSAWNIKVSVPYAPPENSWNYANADPTSPNAHPFWVLTADNTNTGIIGTGDNANITFSFSNILSFTPPGHTQMILLFSGFMVDGTTPYNNAVFVLDMVKQNAPATRGLFYFFSINPICIVNDPSTPINIPLRWAMLDVATVTILVNYPGSAPITKNYPNPPAIGYDTMEITLPGVTQNSTVIITIQSYNGTGGFLNSMQFTLFVQADMFVDPRDSKVYPVQKVNNRLWMAANLDYVASSGSSAYGPEPQYGRLYTFAAAKPNGIPGGWRLPNKADWADLLNTFTYDQLITDGGSGFNAQLNGWMDNTQLQSNFGVYGYYWTGVSNEGVIDYISFSSKSSTANYIGPPNGLSPDWSLSVRYVKDVTLSFK